jgi:predicted Zn finger-like uncharacterized protein
MSDEQYTRCPGCRTIFRVTAQQLALKGGQVRCGHCRTVFDGAAERISLSGAPAASDADAEQGPPTVTLRSAHALKGIDEPEEPPRTTTTRAPDSRPASVPASGAAIDREWENRFAWDRRKAKRRPGPGAAIGVVLLVVLLLVQAAWHFRDALAAHFPAIRPSLARACAMAGCAIRPLRDVAALSIEASDLQADAAHRGLLILSATVRNRAAYPIAYPHLELTLTDAQDQPVVRRAFAPAEFAGGTTDLDAGIAGNGELPVKLFVDASATAQAGYRLYLFYP